MKLEDRVALPAARQLAHRPRRRQEQVAIVWDRAVN